MTALHPPSIGAEGADGPPPRDLRIVTPAGWFDLELDPVLRATRHARMVHRRLGRGPESADLRGQVLTELESLAARAEAQGAVFASIFSELMEGRSVAATLFVFVKPAAVGDDVRATLEDSALALLAASAAGGDGDSPEAEVTVVDLPAGAALRHRRRVGARAFGQTVECDEVSYVVPVPSLHRTLFLEFSTPTLPVADAMAELFDAVAATLRWVW